MTGATSTTGGGSGAAARTLPLLHPSAFRRSTVLTKPVNICFIVSFPSIELLNFHFNRVTDAPDSGRCSVEGNVPKESSRRFQARQSRDCTLLQRQIACQKRREAKSRQIKEVSRQVSARTVEGVESVEKAVTQQPNSSTRNGTGNLMG